MHRSNSLRSPVLRGIIFTAIAGAVLGAIAAAPARSLLAPETVSVLGCAHDEAADEPNSAYYYLPAQFKTPEGPIAEPIATF